MDYKYNNNKIDKWNIKNKTIKILSSERLEIKLLEIAMVCQIKIKHEI